VQTIKDLKVGGSGDESSAVYKPATNNLKTSSIAKNNTDNMNNNIQFHQRPNTQGRSGNSLTRLGSIERPADRPQIDNMQKYGVSRFVIGTTS